jgi:hypothetical protein
MKVEKGVYYLRSGVWLLFIFFIPALSLALIFLRTTGGGSILFLPFGSEILPLSCPILSLVLIVS